MLTAMRLLMLASLPVARAEFDMCARASGLWAGVDMGTGISDPHAVTYSNGSIFIAGYAMGNLSFHSLHKNGAYTDHAGSSSVPDDHSDVTVHHATGSFAYDGSVYTEDGVSQFGMDAVIYQITTAGVPVKVYGVDVVPADEIYNGSSIHGVYGSFAEFYGIDAFDAEPGMVAAGGLFLGKMTFPTSDGSDMVLVNSKDSGYRRRLAPHLLWGGANGFVAKVDMASGTTMWATDDGLTTTDDSNRYYVRTVATTAAGAVLATSDERDSSRNYRGKLVKYDGGNGTKMWEVTYLSLTYIYGVEGDADEEVAYVTCTFEGTNVDPFDTGTNLTSSSDSALVAALDVSGIDGPVAKWVVVIGPGEGMSVKAHGEHLYVYGELSAATTIGDCSLDGTRGGYLVKLKQNDGSCVWAKDVPIGRGGTAVSDGTSVWTFGSTSSTVEYDAEHTIMPNGTESDIHIAKFSASDGTGMWVASVGGTGDEGVAGRGGTGATITPDGPVFVGTIESDSIALGNLAVANLQHARAMNTTGEVGYDFGPAQDGEIALLSMLISNVDEMPSCISSCPNDEISDSETVIAEEMCYAQTECLSKGDASTFLPCFDCDPSYTQKGLSLPNYEHHCFIDDACLPTGTMRPAYQNRNEPSVCEWCDPTVDPTGYSLIDGYVQDWTFAVDVENGQTSSWGRRLQEGEVGQANEWNMLFEKESNGCQIVPDMAPDIDSELAEDIGNTDVAARTANAITAVRSATSINQGAETAWANYVGPCSLTTPDGDSCLGVPAGLADQMGESFQTTFELYKNAVAKTKVVQGLMILKQALSDTNSTDAMIDDLKTDVVAHMLIPLYQGAMKSAFEMDTLPADSDKVTAQTEGAAYWHVIVDAVGDTFSATARATIESTFASPVKGVFNYCAVSTHLLSNLPPGSELQYVNFVREGTMGTIAADSVVHVSLADVGTYQQAESIQCTMPPPPPPFAPPGPPRSPFDLSIGLSDGEVAGIAVGASLAGIVLLVIFGLILRSKLYTDPKPIFTCLDQKTGQTATRNDKGPSA